MLIPESKLILRANALASGGTDDELARLQRRGVLERLQRGAYVPPDLLAGLDASARHRLKIPATLAGLRRPAVVSHASAAVLHGIPLWGVRLGAVEVTRSPPASSDRSGRLRVHVARLDDDEINVIEGFPVTTVTRTVLDLARSLSFESGVVAADFALHTRMTTSPMMAAMVRGMSGIPGSLEAERIVAFADGGSESVGESRSRVAIARLGLAAPRLQMSIMSTSGRRIGICDFGWEEHRVVGEFDGKVKYGRLLKPGQTPGDVVFAEKRREDAIRDEGWEVARWIWEDLSDPAGIAQRISRAWWRARASHEPNIAGVPRALWGPQRQ